MKINLRKTSKSSLQVYQLIEGQQVRVKKMNQTWYNKIEHAK